MDNITHSLVGVALADLTMGRRATKAQRPLLVGAGIIAANLPDIDLAYSRITSAPIGYLLHHRGHTHTVVGLALMALLLASAYWVLPSVRKMRPSGQLRFLLLIAIALASHLALDALNSYGVHPWYPVENSWYFGDAVFVVEPALWLILGFAVAWNARSRTAWLAAGLPILILLLTISSMSTMPRESVAALALVGVLFAWMARRMSPPARAATALTAMVFIMAAMVVVSREARAESVSALGPRLRGRLVDVILTPNPSSPLCWSLIAIESRDADGEYVLWRGTLSLAPSLKAPTSCAFHRLAPPGDTRIIGDGRLALGDEIHQSLWQLRELARHNCWVRAWLRFGRAPVIEGGKIFDLRFADRRTQNFTHMPLVREPGEAPCPRFVPSWEMPRADLLQ